MGAKLEGDDIMKSFIASYFNILIIANGNVMSDEVLNDVEKR